MKLFSKKGLLTAAAVASLTGGVLISASVQAQDARFETCISAPYIGSGYNVNRLYGGQGYGPAQYNACISDRESLNES